MTERATSAIKGLAPWIALCVTILVLISNIISARAVQAEQTNLNTKRIEQLDDRKADRRELDDLKEMVRGIDRKLDKLMDRSK